MKTRNADTASLFYSRVAGFLFLFYIAVGLTQIALFGGTTAGEGTVARLATMALRAPDVRINVVLGLLTCFVALGLGAALYAITRAQDHDLAMLALACRIGEGVIGGASIPLTLGLLSLATETSANTTDAAVASAAGLLILTARTWNVTIAASFFAVGSTFFSWIFLRGRLIPVALAWLGVVSSVLLVVGLPLQILTVLKTPLATYMWIPMAVFEIVLAVWLLIKGVATPARRPIALSYADSTP